MVPWSWYVQNDCTELTHNLTFRVGWNQCSYFILIIVIYCPSYGCMGNCRFRKSNKRGHIVKQYFYLSFVLNFHVNIEDNIFVTIWTNDNVWCDSWDSVWIYEKCLSLNVNYLKWQEYLLENMGSHIFLLTYWPPWTVNWNLKMTNFWDISPRSLVELGQCFKCAYSLHQSSPWSHL